MCGITQLLLGEQGWAWGSGANTAGRNCQFTSPELCQNHRLWIQQHPQSTAGLRHLLNLYLLQSCDGSCDTPSSTLA